MPSDHSEGLIFAMVGRQFRTSLRIEMVSTDLFILFLFFFCFLGTILYHLLDCKMVSDRFQIFFFFFFNGKSLPLSLSPVLIQNRSFIGVT